VGPRPPEGLTHLRSCPASHADLTAIRTIGSVELRRKRFDRPDEVRRVEKARIELVELGELAVGRASFEPGWRWSEHVKPIVGTETCQVHHIGYVVSGHLHVEMTDGATLEVLGGDAFEIPPGHDAWVIGDEPWVSIDWAGRRLFARSPQEISDRIFATVVFTDLSGSTETLNRIGDAQWRPAARGTQ
jgi:quercetin dioxygenase-like cupin family protein